MRKAVKDLMENRRQALSSAGVDCRSGDEVVQSWSSLLGEVSSRKAARFANKEQSTYEVQAEADVKGTALDPSDEVTIQFT